MGDSSKFCNFFTYYTFHIGFVILIIMELFIYLYTFKKNSPKEKRADKGTKWLLYFNFIFCILVSIIFVSRRTPHLIRNLLFPTMFSFIGILLIYIGIVIRITAVLTLRKSFTLSVQTQKSQQLIKTGLYKYIRHPAYSGSILSLIGISLAFKNIVATVLVIICCMSCYHIRILVEEKVLLEYFGKEYNKYKLNTKKLFPKIFLNKK